MVQKMEVIKMKNIIKIKNKLIKIAILMIASLQFSVQVYSMVKALARLKNEIKIKVSNANDANKMATFVDGIQRVASFIENKKSIIEKESGQYCLYNSLFKDFVQIYNNANFNINMDRKNLTRVIQKDLRTSIYAINKINRGHRDIGSYLTFCEKLQINPNGLDNPGVPVMAAARGRVGLRLADLQAQLNAAQRLAEQYRNQ